MRKVFAALLVIAFLLLGCWPPDDSASQPTWSNQKPPTPVPVVCMEWDGRDYVEAPCSE
jgi:hypothetical protein